MHNKIYLHAHWGSRWVMTNLRSLRIRILFARLFSDKHKKPMKSLIWLHINGISWINKLIILLTKRYDESFHAMLLTYSVILQQNSLYSLQCLGTDFSHFHEQFFLSNSFNTLRLRISTLIPKYRFWWAPDNALHIILLSDNVDQAIIANVVHDRSIAQLMAILKNYLVDVVALTKYQWPISELIPYFIKKKYIFFIQRL